MAGHSKWANIQHRKKGQDAKRGKLFTKFIREITVAARVGGSDPAANPRLRLAVDKALGKNMPKDTVERAIKRGAGELESVVYEEIRYEGYGAGGVAVMVDCMTDNRNRTVSAVRHAFSKMGGNMGTDGSVAYLFDKCGVLVFESVSDEDALLEAALEAGAEDVLVEQGGAAEVLTGEADFVDVKASMQAAGFAPLDAEVTMRPQTRQAVSAEQGASVLKLLDLLEDLDDVQAVYSNADIPDESYQQL